MTNATITLKTQEENITEKVQLDIKNSKLSYVENNKTQVLFDIKNKILIRENQELYMELSFQEEKSLIYVKNLRKNIEITLKTKKIDIKKNKIMIQYELENQNYLYQIEMED